MNLQPQDGLDLQTLWDLSCITEDNLRVEQTRISTFSALRKAGFPVYPKIQDAIYSIGKYWEWVAKQGIRKREPET